MSQLLEKLRVVPFTLTFGDTKRLFRFQYWKFFQEKLPWEKTISSQIRSSWGTEVLIWRMKFLFIPTAGSSRRTLGLTKMLKWNPEILCVFCTLKKISYLENIVEKFIPRYSINTLRHQKLVTSIRFQERGGSHHKSVIVPKYCCPQSLTYTINELVPVRQCDFWHDSSVRSLFRHSAS